MLLNYLALFLANYFQTCRFSILSAILFETSFKLVNSSKSYARKIGIVFRDGKEPSLLGFGCVRVLTKVRVQFGASSSQVQKIWVRFGFGSYLLSFEFGLVRFYMMLYVLYHIV